MPLSYEGGHKEKILGSNESSSLTEELLAMNASLCFDNSILPMVWLVHLGFILMLRVSQLVNSQLSVCCS